MNQHYTRRRASMYITIVGCATLTAVIGISALMALRIERRAAEDTGHAAEARIYAQSAVELGAQLIATDSSWRTTKANGDWQSNRPMGAGTYSLSVTDPDDGDLSDSAGDDVVLTGTGIRGRARHMLQIRLQPTIVPLEALNTCLHAGGPTTTLAGYTMACSGAPLSCNGTLQNNGSILGDVEVLLLAGAGSISGTATVPAPSKPMPASGVIATYKARATIIPSSADVNSAVITPGYNSLGPTNPDGVYRLSAGTGDLKIQKSRIQGTLIVELAAGRKCTIDEPSFIHAYRSDYPVLLVEGDLELSYKSSTTISESVVNLNLNPTGAPYQGVADNDKLDTYPNEIQGLIHVTGSLAIKQDSNIKGAVICESSVSWEKSSTITHDPLLYTNPPEGYFDYGPMQIKQGSWRQIVDE